MCIESEGRGRREHENDGFMRWPEADERHGIHDWLQSIKNWTFFYMADILDKGAERARSGHRLTHDHLYDVPSRMRSSALLRAFSIEFESKSGKRWQLIRALWKVAAPDFIPAGFCEFVALSCQIALPLLVRGLLKVLEDKPQEKVIKEGMLWSLGIFGCSFFNAFASHRHRHLAMKSGISLRAATINAIYKHLLHLSPEGKLGLTSGELTNLVATDTQKLYEVAQDGHLAWALPVAMIVVSSLLVTVLGWTTLIGVAVLLLFVPIVRGVTTSMIAIRSKRVKYTDLRIKLCSSMLQGIQVTKLNGYEDAYQKRITSARRKELATLRKELAVWALTLVLTVISPVVATCATFVLYILIDGNNTLTASRSFTALLLFSSLRFPISYAGRLLGKATQAYSAVQRISAFLSRSKQAQESSNKHGIPLKLDEACFTIKGPDFENVFQVGAFSFEVNPGEVVAVCGPVGGGKSTFINGIIGEIGLSPTSVLERCDLVGYARQTAFIMNATLRENILFGRAFDEQKYDKVINACCLKTDLDLLGPSRDLTEIGERGVTLSGGQKQRVALARVAYASANLNLLDDPLSALDAETGAAVFSRLIKGPQALFRESAVVLVTHAAHFLNQVDRIVLIVAGKCAFNGSWDELAKFETNDERIRRGVDTLRFSATELPHGDSRLHVEKQSGSTDEKRKGAADTGKLMTVEERMHGLSSAGTWLLWFQRAGGIYYLSLQILFMTIDRLSYVAVEFFLARWTDGVNQPISVLGVDFSPQIDGWSAQRKYLYVYGGLVAASVTTTTLRSEWSVTGGARAAKKVFHKMLTSILGAPLSYFETTPVGRLLNRFSYDMEVIDVTLTQNMSMLMISISWYVAGVCVMVSVIPWMVLAIVPVTFLYWMLLLHYRRSGSDLQRLDAVSRSPVQASVNEALDGSATIRMFHQTSNVLTKFQTIVDTNSSALLNFVTAQRWLGIRIELLGSVVVLVSGVLVTSLNDIFRIDAGLVGLLILWSSNFTITLGFCVDTFGEAEAAITAIERVDAMAHIEQERERETNPLYQVSQSWPEAGELVFRNVKLRYRPGLPLALAGLNFRVEAGKRCGIVGRTGAGKSSLTVALFRLVEIESGEILLDDIDLSKIGLNDVRGRAMTIIPQDPFLAGETIRECVDPFQEHQDEKILDALRDVRLADGAGSLDFLDVVVEEGGSNFSVGERQLVFFARAMLAKKKVLVLDEATSSIDRESDDFIQKMLRTKFPGTTILTIAHRLETVIDFDQIIVLDAGKVVESGAPHTLLQRNSVFSHLVDASGPEASASLRAVAKNVNSSKGE